MIPIKYNARNLVVRWKTTLMTASGFTLVIAALVVMLAFVAGVEQVCTTSGQPENVIVLAKGNNDEVFSQIDRRAQTRIGFLKHCEADAKKLCTASQKDDGAVIECLLSAKRLGWRCNMAVTEANFR